MQDERFTTKGKVRNPCVCCGNYGTWNKDLQLTFCKECWELVQDSPSPIEAARGLMVTAQEVRGAVYA